MSSGDVDGYRGGGEPFGTLVRDVVVARPGRQVIASFDHLLKTVGDVVEVLPEVWLDG